MNLELEKKSLKRYICVCKKSILCEESAEMIVPDQSPDIMRIIKGCADVFLKDKNTREGKVDISGCIKGEVLYTGEGESCVRRLPVSMPFATLVDCAGVTAESELMASAFIRSLDVREINPRKVAVRANVEVRISAYERNEIEACCNVPDVGNNGVCTHKRVCSVYYPSIIREKGFSISDDIELTGEECNMNSLLSSDVAVEITDVKVIGNKAILKGIANIGYVYETEEERLGCGEYELPISQILDIEGMSEENDIELAVAVTGFELDPQYDAAGKAHYMTTNISADVTAVVSNQENFEFVDDVYSTKYNLDIERHDDRCEKMCAKSDKRVAVNESIETGTNVKSVLDVCVNIAPPVRRREENGEFMAADAMITVMYVGDDGGIYSASRRATAVCPIPLESEHNYDARVAVKGKSFSVGMANEINVRFFADFDVMDTEEISVPVISQITLDEEDLRNSEKAPSVIVRRLNRDYDIWSLAKEHATTVEEIRLANGIVDDANLTMGRMVLIPKKR